tara:strand:- start:184 stop:1215 length:1032 start_codon:yes stop_codon:yes gene_type:complete
MLGTYSYHEIFRKTIVAFGTLFNNIELRRQDEVMKVPLAYGPKQKFLARLDQVPDPTNKRVSITLPRLSFEISGVNYDSARKVSPTQKIKFPNSSSNNKNAYMPVPYNIGFELAIIAKNQDDGLQIIEQILPFFQPHYNLAVKLATSIGETKDVPVVLNSIDYEDDYEGDFATRRAIIYTLQFTAKTYLYGPITDAKVIRKSITDYYSSTDTTKAPRQVRYTGTPTSTVDRDGVGLTTLTAAMDINDGIISVASTTGLEQGDDIQIGTEVMHVNRVVGSTLHVSRGWNNSSIAGHANGSSILKIDEADAALLDSDDDFGFGELYADFTDMKKRNPTSGADEAI